MVSILTRGVSIKDYPVCSNSIFSCHPGKFVHAYHLPSEMSQAERVRTVAQKTTHCHHFVALGSVTILPITRKESSHTPIQLMASFVAVASGSYLFRVFAVLAFVVSSITVHNLNHVWVVAYSASLSAYQSSLSFNLVMFSTKSFGPMGGATMAQPIHSPPPSAPCRLESLK